MGKEGVYIFSLINLFLAALGLCCCLGAFSGCSERGLLSVAVNGLLTAGSSLVAELRPEGTWAPAIVVRGLSSVQFSDSVVSNSLRPHGLQHVRPPCPSPTPGLTYPTVYRIFSAEGSNPCPPAWAAGFLTTGPPGKFKGDLDFNFWFIVVS